MELSHGSTVVESESSQSGFDFNRTLKVALYDSLISKLGKHAYTASNLAQQEQAQLEACVQRHLKNHSLVWTPPVSGGICRAFSVYLEPKFRFSFISKESRSHTPKSP